jgi:ATP-dependent exoDNAse (exonuclease V) beta subunit
MSKKNMSNEEYHAHPAIGSTTLKYAVEDMKLFQAAIQGRLDKEESSSMAFGTLAHAVVLEDKMDNLVSDAQIIAQIMASKPDTVRPTNTSRYKIWRAEQLEAKKEIIKISDHERLKGMKEAFEKHPIASNVIFDGVAESSYFTTIDGIEYKARPDYLVESRDGNYLVDYKTIGKDLTIKNVEAAIANYRYDISAVHYLQVVERVTGLNIPDFVWIFQETKAPYRCLVYRASPAMLERATKQCVDAYRKIAVSKETDSYRSSFEERIITGDLPAWKVKEIEEQED